MINFSNEPVRSVPKSRNGKERNPNYTYRNGRAYTEITCSHCNNKFERRADQENRRSKYNYCSAKCANTANGLKAVGKTFPARRTGKVIKCHVCEKDFYAAGHRIRDNTKFCSIKCHGKYQQDQPLPKGFITSADNKGEKNGRYKHGNRVGGHVSKVKVRAAVKDRDGNWCLNCGKPGPGLHLHRIVYGSQGGKYEVDNCVLLCNIHHEEIHSSKKKWLPILSDHIQSKKVSGL